MQLDFKLISDTNAIPAIFKAEPKLSEDVLMILPTILLHHTPELKRDVCWGIKLQQVVKMQTTPEKLWLDRYMDDYDSEWTFDFKAGSVTNFVTVRIFNPKIATAFRLQFVK